MTADEQWHAWRDAGIGASDVPAILGVSSFDSPWSLWAKKTGRVGRGETTQRQRIGQVLEGAIAQLFHEETGLHVAGEQTWCAHRDLTWARATVDGFVIRDRDDVSFYHDDPVGVFEAKTDGAPNWDSVPPRIYAQVQWQMFVTDMPRAWVAVLHSGFQFRVHEVGRDNSFIVDAVNAATRFWFDHVQTGTPPPVDGTDATRDAIANTWPEHEQGKVASLDDLVDVIDHRDVLKAEIKHGQDALAQAENLIKEALADAEVGTIRGIPVVTYKTQTKTSIDQKALRLAHPDIAAEFETSSTYRVLRAVSSKVRGRAA